MRSISILVTALLATCIVAEYAAFDMSGVMKKMKKAALVPDFATHAALQYFSPLKASATAAAENTTIVQNTTNNGTIVSNNNEEEEDVDRSFWGGFVASLAMICFAEFGDRVPYFLLS